MEVTDDSTVSFFEDLEGNQKEEAVKSALRLGVGVLKMSGTTSEVDYVDRRFCDFEDKIKEMFDEENKQSVISKIDDVISEYFDEESGNINKLLDPHAENTPASKLLSSLRSDLEIIKKELGIEEERKKGTQKGFDFEDDEVGPKLSRLSRIFGDSLKDTSETEGPLGDVGDFVVKVNSDKVLGFQGKIVFEAKDRKGYSRNDILEELKEAKENRGADIGVMVFSEEAASSLRSEIEHYQYYSNEDCFACCIEDTGIPLEIAYKRARFLVTKRILKEKADIDINELENLADSIERELETFSSIKSRITQDKNTITKSIEDSYDGLYEELEELETKLEESLEKFGEAIKTSE